MNNIEKILEEVTKKLHLSEIKEISRGTYYQKDYYRNAVYFCKYKNQEVVLKIYDEPKDTFEPTALEAFHLHNKSSKITAPKLYASEQINTKQGWLLMEKLPPGKFYSRPLAENERQEFMDVFLEYRANFPMQPTRELMLIENLKADEFHILRINRWLELANTRDYQHLLEHKKRIIEPQLLTKLYSETEKIIRKEFKNRSMIWCHGHFNNHQLYRVNSQKFYLIDFGHTHLFPEGYELAFILWADYIMAENFQLPFKKWLEGIESWLKLLITTAKKLKLKNSEKLMYASLLERTIGTIFADILASDKPLEEKQQRLKLLFQLANFCIAKYQKL